MPLPLVGAGIGAVAGGLFGAGKEVLQKFDHDPSNDKFEWGTVAKDAAIGGLVGGTLGFGAAALGVGGAAAGGAATAGTTAAETAAVGTQLTLPGMEAATAGTTAAETAASGSRFSRLLNSDQFSKAGTAMNAYNNHEMKSDLNNIQANTAMSWQSQAGFRPSYGTADSSNPGYVS